MIRSDPWSRYQVQRDRRPVRRRMLLVIPLVVLLLYVAVHFVGVDWAHTQAIPLLDLGEQRWEVLWVPDTVITGFQHHHLGTGQTTNLLQVRWR